MPRSSYRDDPEFDLDVDRTFAEGEETCDAWSRPRDLEWHAPAGAVHAGGRGSRAVRRRR